MSTPTDLQKTAEDLVELIHSRKSAQEEAREAELRCQALLQKETRLRGVLTERVGANIQSRTWLVKEYGQVVIARWRERDSIVEILNIEEA